MSLNIRKYKCPPCSAPCQSDHQPEPFIGKEEDTRLSERWPQLDPHTVWAPRSLRAGVEEALCVWDLS